MCLVKLSPYFYFFSTLKIERSFIYSRFWIYGLLGFLGKYAFLITLSNIRRITKPGGKDNLSLKCAVVKGIRRWMFHTLHVRFLGYFLLCVSQEAVLTTTLLKESLHWDHNCQRKMRYFDIISTVCSESPFFLIPSKYFSFDLRENVFFFR